MRLSRKTIANRANGKLSRGPKTEAGKQRAVLNRTRHGLLSRIVVLDNERQETFDRLLEQHIARLNPADDLEYAAVEEMAAATWRLRRLWAIETSLFNKSIEKRTEFDQADRLSGAFSQLAATPDLHLLDRYETRLHRMYQRSLSNLLLLRQMADEETDVAGEQEAGANDDKADGNQAHGDQTPSDEPDGEETNNDEPRGGEAQGDQKHGNQAHNNQAHNNQTQGDETGGYKACEEKAREEGVKREKYRFLFEPTVP